MFTSDCPFNVFFLFDLLTLILTAYFTPYLPRPLGSILAPPVLCFYRLPLDGSAITCSPFLIYLKQIYANLKKNINFIEKY
jgi:hypothetical protein